MRNDGVCKFFATDQSDCDVGHGYISSHDVEVIVRHCIAHYEECPRYQVLAALAQLPKKNKQWCRQ